MSAHCSAGAAATAAAGAACALLGLGVARAFPLVASLADAPLPCQMQLCFVARLSHRECVGKSDQVCTTVLKARDTDVQQCNSVKSTCNSTETERDTETETETDRQTDGHGGAG